MREWKKIEGFDFKEIIFEEYNHIAKITINRERYRNAFTPLTTWEMAQAFNYCRDCLDIRVVILTGAGDKAFCAGGDMHVKGRGGYVGNDGVPRLNVLDVQMQIRRLPKPVIAMVNGYAIGRFMRAAAKEPWFANTVFVFLGDHGKMVGQANCELPSSYNHIPLLISGPGIEAGQDTAWAGQVDVAPTLLGLLRVAYVQNNFGI